MPGGVPQNGGDMTTPFPPHTDLDSTGRLAGDLPCIRCGYNLKTLLPDGICPECGLSIDQSIRRGLLRYSDPQWVARIAAGMRWVVSGLVCAFIVGCLGEIMRPFDLIPAIGLLGVFLVGFWRFTSPEPDKTQAEPLSSMRRIARVGSIGGLLLVPFSSISGVTLVHVGSKISLSPGGLGLTAGWLLILAYAGRLAKRLPDPRLAKDTRVVTHGLGICLPVALVVDSLRRLLPGSSTPINGLLATIPILLAAPGMILGLWSIKLVLDYRRQFRYAAEEARGHSQLTSPERTARS